VGITHGDFRMGNVLFHPTEPRVVAILDWELSTLGHPLADLGFVVMPWHSAPDEYGGILGLDRAALGLPSEADFIARYREGRPRSAPLLPFHRAFAMFRFAVIFQGIADRARAGTAAAADAGLLAPLAERFAIRAMAALDRPAQGA
jgi:aminoglycoside phosphotransferase (APT) family kinase protein